MEAAGGRLVCSSSLAKVRKLKIELGAYDPWIESVIISINKDEGTFFSNRGQVSVLNVRKCVSKAIVNKRKSGGKSPGCSVCSRHDTCTAKRCIRSSSSCIPILDQVTMALR